MINHARRVVITGLGTVNCTGLTIEESWANVLAGKSGIGYFDLYDASALNVRIGGQAWGFDPTKYMDAREARRRDRFCQLAVAATRQALDHAGLKITEDSADEIGCVYGTGAGGLQSFAEFIHVFDKEGHRRLHPFAVPMVLDDSASSAIAIDWNLRGPNFAPVSACAAGADAIGLAYRLICNGDAQAIVAGGTEMPLHALPMAAFDRLGAMSRNNDQPQMACRPFDKHRDGLVMGEGAATLIMEELSFAQARGAQILAEVVGYGCTSDAFHVTAPAENGIGAAKAMRRALCDAGLTPADIDWISPHATATDLNDKFETAAIRSIFGECAERIPVSGTKAMTGHMMAATGALEVLFGIKAIETGWIPPTINYETPDPECSLDYVPNQARQVTVNAFMSNAFGFGGHNSVLIFRRYAE
ncbi:3-oxoacyl-[acyl-carrier-protein] synthase II [Thermoflexales bacterium]|nr:3-oxoacyl-[acyl-carrier-protein] synthase II [Thermoflexales bacterium]